MKYLPLFFGLLVSTSALADCIDRRAVRLEQCQDRYATYFFEQGNCERDYEFESFYCAIPGEPVCTDLRAAMIEPCEDGQELVFVQGQCSKSYEFEHFYCR